MGQKLREGDKAPDFVLVDDSGEEVRFYDRLQEGPVMLVFFPDASTPVCTAQLCSYDDRYADFRKLGFQIIGISDDPVGKLEEFQRQKGLGFSLLSDPDHEVIDQFGGSGFLSGGAAHRANFLIDTDGIISYGHVEKLSVFYRKADELLEAAREIAGGQPSP